MSKRFCVFCLTLFLCLCQSVFLHAAKPTGQERILSMDVEMEIHGSGLVSVTEHIVFESAGRDIKRGIVRELPKYWTRPDGKRGRVSYHSIKVKRDGELEFKHFKESRSLLEIYIGDSDVMLTPGIHEYAIEYGVSGAILRKDNVDSLYWNATGNGWIFPIEQASFRLYLSGALRKLEDKRVVERDFFTGETGDEKEAARILPDGGVASTKTLAPGEGMTVFYSWPTAITAAVKVEEFRGGLAYSLIPSFKFLYVFIPVLFLLVFYACFARRWGMGRTYFQIIPIFDPPVDLMPGDARYAVKGRYDYQAFAADILALVNKKYLFLVYVAEPSGAEVSALSRYPEPGDENSLDGVTPEKLRPGELLPPGGISFYDRLFPKKFDAVELNAKNPHDGSRIVGDLRLGSGMSLVATYSYLSAEHSKKYRGMFKPARLVLAAGLFIWFFLTLFVLGVFESGDAAAGFGALIILPCLSLLVIGLPLAMVFKNAALSGFGKKVKYCGLALVYLSFGVMLVFNMNIWRLTGTLFREYFGIGSIWEASGPAGSLLAFVLAVALFAAACKFLPRCSAKGYEMQAQAKGVEMYLKTVEEHRFEALYSPEEKVRHFELLLPYALALGVGETWANNFATYCKKAGLADLAQREVAHMRSSSGISHSISRTASRSAAQGRSSGSGRSSSSRGGGGGRSGGGAGGGGGRGW